MAYASHDLSFVACISRFFAVLAEFEVFVVCSRHVFHTSDFRLTHDLLTRTHAHLWVINFEYAWLSPHPSWMHYFKNLLMLLLPVQLEC